MTHSNELDYLKIPNEDGTEEKFEILFTFDHEETGKKYMFVTPAEETEDEYQEVLAFRYTEENGEFQLEMIDEENDEEWDMVEEVFNTYMAGFETELDDEEAKQEERS